MAGFVSYILNLSLPSERNDAFKIEYANNMSEKPDIPLPAVLNSEEISNDWL